MSIGARIGTVLGILLEPVLGDRGREHYAKRYGRCRRCARPLGGESPSKICETCHADVLLERMGGGNGGDA